MLAVLLPAVAAAISVSGIGSSYYVGDKVSFTVSDTIGGSCTQYSKCKFIIYEHADPESNSPDTTGNNPEWIVMYSPTYNLAAGRTITASASFYVLEEMLQGYSSKTGTFEASLYCDGGGCTSYQSSWAKKSWTANAIPSCTPSTNTITITSFSGSASGVSFSAKVRNNGCSDIYVTYYAYVDGTQVGAYALSSPIAPGGYYTDSNSISTTISPGSHTFKVKLASSLGGDYDTESFSIAECSPGNTQSQTCATGGCGGTQSRTCDSSGTWGSWGACTKTDACCGISCGTGQYCSGGYCYSSCGDGSCNNGETCSTCSSDCGACPVCAPGQTESLSGDITYAYPVRVTCACTVTRTCQLNGTWGNWGLCTRTDPCCGVSCSSGQYCSGGSCVSDCSPGQTGTSSCVVGGSCVGVTSRTCQSNGTWGAWGSCSKTDPCCGVSCASGLYCSGGACFSNLAISGIGSNYSVGQSISFNISGKVGGSCAQYGDCDFIIYTHADASLGSDVSGNNPEHYRVHYYSPSLVLSSGLLLQFGATFQVLDEMLEGQASKTGDFEARLYCYGGGCGDYYSPWAARSWTAKPAPPSCVPSQNKIGITAVSGNLSGASFSVRIYNNNCTSTKADYYAFIDGIYAGHYLLSPTIAPNNSYLDTEWVAMSLLPGSHTLKVNLSASMGGASASSSFTVAAECSAGVSQSQTCPVGSCAGTQNRSCQSSGTWGSWGACIKTDACCGVSCDLGYKCSGGACAAAFCNISNAYWSVYGPVPGGTRVS
ncbi:MAG: hypothetical protein NTY90_05670, partial [Candidatus Micrarchaeota archaeon]|nr:hypothetical protein [Candidatus Micrarchaeota archaeon]